MPSIIFHIVLDLIYILWTIIFIFSIKLLHKKKKNQDEKFSQVKAENAISVS